MPDHILLTEIILYVRDQQRSRDFYSRLLRCEPDLHVPGMTEYIIGPGCKLGLMPNAGIARILEGKTPHPDTGDGIPRCELYLYVSDVQAEFEHCVLCGAALISPPQDRDWGDRACYFADPDGHIIAFAQSLRN